MLLLKNITKSFAQTTALQAIDLSIESGSTTVIIGPSGCGKSTLIRLIIGLISPDSGSIDFDGQKINSENILSLRRKMGYVIQEGGLFPHLTALKNVTIMARYLNWEPDRIQQRINELTELTQFPADALNRYPVQLSGGQSQRVSLMRALMLDPSVLLLDEPLGSLDPMIRADLQADLKNIFQKLKKTVVLVTHDMGEAGYFGETIVLMRDGKIIQKGSLKQLVQQPADRFVTRFINAQRSPLENMGNLS